MKKLLCIFASVALFAACNTNENNESVIDMENDTIVEIDSTVVCDTIPMDTVVMVEEEL